MKSNDPVCYTIWNAIDSWQVRQWQHYRHSKFPHAGLWWSAALSKEHDTYTLHKDREPQNTIKCTMLHFLVSLFCTCHEKCSQVKQGYHWVWLIQLVNPYSTEKHTAQTYSSELNRTVEFLLKTRYSSAELPPSSFFSPLFHIFFLSFERCSSSVSHETFTYRGRWVCGGPALMTLWHSHALYRSLSS